MQLSIFKEELESHRDKIKEVYHSENNLLFKISFGIAIFASIYAITKIYQSSY